MKRRSLFIGLSTIVIVALAAFVIIDISKPRTEMVIPTINADGTVGVRFVSEQGLFASVVSPVPDSSNSMRIFQSHESPLVGAEQPNDIIAFACPAGSSLSSWKAFQNYHNGISAYVWGPYVGDEVERILDWIEAGKPTVHPNHPDNVFDAEKFGGRAAGYFDNPMYPISDGVYFASAEAVPGDQVSVRCVAPDASVCGDGFLDWDIPNAQGGYEACDDGNEENGDACNDQCQLTWCGDGVAQSPNGYGDMEQCDDGVLNGQPGHCAAGCVASYVDVKTEKENSATPKQGENFSYAVRVWNAGNVLAEDVFVQDLFDEGLVFISEESSSECALVTEEVCSPLIASCENRQIVRCGDVDLPAQEGVASPVKQEFTLTFQYPVLANILSAPDPLLEPSQTCSCLTKYGLVSGDCSHGEYSGILFRCNEEDMVYDASSCTALDDIHAIASSMCAAKCSE